MLSIVEVRSLRVKSKCAVIGPRGSSRACDWLSGCRLSVGRFSAIGAVIGPRGSSRACDWLSGCRLSGGRFSANGVVIGPRGSRRLLYKGLMMRLMF